MRIALAPRRFCNGDLAFNLRQIEKALSEASGRADLLLLGECFLQGFDAFCWDYARDREIALALDDPLWNDIRGLLARFHLDIGLGFLEREGESLYSSYLLLGADGQRRLYRRISVGWKEAIADGHYREGEESRDFLWRGQTFRVALCGDLWDAPERFRTEGVLLWPVYVNFTPEEWRDEEKEYAEQTGKAARRVLMVNSLSDDPVSHGGAFDFVSGAIAARVPYDEESLLIAEI